MAAAPRKPQDHKKPAVERDAEFAEMEGADLLRPLSHVKASDQARLTGRLMNLGLISEDVDAAEDALGSMDFDAFADLIDYIEERFVVDAEGFAEFSRGAGSMMRTMGLVVAYAVEMGKDVA